MKLNSCIQYCSELNLATNQSKLSIINLSSRQHEHSAQPVVLVIDILQEEIIESTMFLGMYLDQGMTWGYHIDNLPKHVQ